MSKRRSRSREEEGQERRSKSRVEEGGKRRSRSRVEEKQATIKRLQVIRPTLNSYSRISTLALLSSLKPFLLICFLHSFSSS